MDRESREVQGTAERRTAAMDILPPRLRDEIHDPDRRLRLAVLEDAIRYVQRYAHATDRRARVLYEDALDWFRSSDRSEPFAFESVCGVLRLDADGIRRRLDRWQRADDARRHLRAA
jgi:hypothetical protein